jgi:hypothetical protein
MLLVIASALTGRYCLSALKELRKAENPSFNEQGKKMLNLRVSFLSLLCLLTACVTINIYFPAAAAEKAADQIIDKVYGSEQSDEQSDPPNTQETDKTSAFPDLTPLVNLLVPVAYAQADLDISSPAIQALSRKMSERHQQLLPFYNKGAIGLTHHALIVLRAPHQVPLKSRNKVKQWIEKENADRLALYREIAVANHHPEWEANIRATFATRWIKRAAQGWWYQDEKGRWQQR